MSIRAGFHKKIELAERGRTMVQRFCDNNQIYRPSFYQSHYPDSRLHPSNGNCGWYTPETGTIHLIVSSCASLGYAGRSWSWPGYVIDRTPFGVCCHELGHHVDALNRCRLSCDIHTESGEKPLTGYAPNRHEWFAEMFRLFVTNPDLLKRVRPLTYTLIISHGLKPIERRPWNDVLKGCPERTMLMARKKFAKQGALL